MNRPSDQQTNSGDLRLIKRKPPFYRLAIADGAGDVFYIVPALTRDGRIRTTAECERALRQLNREPRTANREPKTAQKAPKTAKKGR